uniref:(California timema) hypothetical protein n=1 Tax=Timema californicum TaxID=61474 RepID=A0A7R9J2W2_TIMCA|nr:unnamed protein product [Timema californicum]
MKQPRLQEDVKSTPALGQNGVHSKRNTYMVGLMKIYQMNFETQLEVGEMEMTMMKLMIIGGPDFPALHPSMEPEDGIGQPKGNDPADIRDKFLKPEYREKNRAHLLPPDFSPRSNQDTDLDDRVKTGDLEIILGNLPFSSDSNISPNTSPIPGGASMYFGQSVTSKTIRRPDGSVEHHRTVRNNQGQEETTVTRQIGDQSHSLTTQTDRNGVQQRVEKFVNLDEGKLDEFENKWNKQYQPAVPKLSDDETRPHNWFPFDKFFK